MLTATFLMLFAQLEAPPPTPQTPPPPTEATVRIDTEASGVRLVERATKKTACSAPCGQLLRTDASLEYVLEAPGAVSSDPFALRGATTDVTLGWRPGMASSRGLGTALIIVGGLAVMTAIAMGLAAMAVGISCAAGTNGCPRVDWAWATLPLSVGGYLVLGIGMTLTFRFGFEELTIDVKPAPGA